MATSGWTSQNATAEPDWRANLDADLKNVAEKADHAAFRRIFGFVAPKLKSFLMKQGLGEALADDVLQETMLKVWRKAHLFDNSKSSGATWIYAIARNVKIDRLREEARPAPDPDDPYYVPDPPETGEEFVVRKQDGNRLRDAMGILPADQMQIVSMSFFEEKSHTEIAEKLDLPLGTVKSRIRLAFVKIRAELEAQK